MIGHGADSPQLFRRLSVGLNSARCIRIDTREILIVTLARGKGTILGVVGSIVGTTDTIEDVLAVVCGVRASRVTSLDTESIASHEVVPFNDLLQVFGITTESIGVKETTKRVTTQISTMGIEFTSVVVSF